jgi:predicted amidophosphoribosyltransferase
LYYLYRIDSNYDGFTPSEIPRRIENKHYLTYNWNQYFDEVERGDMIFTYFFGSKQPRGIYLISKIVKFPQRGKVKAKILDYESEKPIISQEEFAKFSRNIINRPRGSVFVIPPFLEGIFDKVLQDRVSSDIEISEEIDCYECFKKNAFPCEKCSIFDRDYVINWQKEVKLTIPGYEGIVSPFWIIPHQSHWTKISIRKHVISRIFYSFKAGYKVYTRLFARGIQKAIENDPKIRKVKFDCILGIPLSPKKKEHGEIDRVSLVCAELSKLIKTDYYANAMTLSKHISRKEYRHYYNDRKFINDYKERLSLRLKKSLNNKNVLIIDDVITDGKTLQATSGKIKEAYPNVHLFAATCGIFAKKRNVQPLIAEKFQRYCYGYTYS